MKGIVLAFIACFAFYLVLTAGSGSMVAWSLSELCVGFFFSVAVALMSSRFVAWDFSGKALDPRRWVLLAIYLAGPFFFQLAKANLDVAYRVVTGRINPGIVKVSTGLDTDLGVALLANSITLTPGTLSVDLNDKNELFVHWINVTDKKPKPEQVYGSMGKWVKRVVE